MNNKKKLGAAFISLAVSGFAGLMLVAPGALATTWDGGVVGTVLTDAKCDWQIHDVPEDFALKSDGDVQYTGAELVLTGVAQNLNIYVSGAQPSGKTESGHTPCIFYKDAGLLNKTRPEINLSVASVDFEASYENDDSVSVKDTNMNFSLTSDDPMKISLVEDPTNTKCNGKEWSSASGEFGGESTEFTVIEIQEEDDVIDSQGAVGLRCEESYIVSFTLPQGKVPEGAGRKYSFSGVTLTTTLLAIGSVKQ